MRRTIPTLLVAGTALAVLVAVLAPRGGNGAGADAAGGDRWPIVTIEHEGGFVMPEMLFTRLPTAHLTADGHLLTQGPQIMIFPGPLLPNLRDRALTEEGIAAVRALAREAGLDEAPPDYGQPPVADATTTAVTYTDESGRTIVHRAYALGLLESSPPGPGPDGSDRGGPGPDPGIGLTAEQQAARQRLSDFVTALSDPEASLPAGSVGPDEDHVITAFRIRARQVTGAEPAATPPTSTRAWPLTRVPLAGAGTCLPVTGPDAAVLRDTLAGVDAGAQWTDGGATWTLSVRPLLPGDSRC